MPRGAETFVLDTSALLALKDDEPGASEVEALLRQHGRKEAVFISFMSIMELAYILEQEQGEAAARLGVLQLKQLPLQVVESDEPLGLAAARIKARHKLSVADAWIAATAERLGATLVHKDPEFESLAGVVPQKTLPPKTGRGGSS
ncbi:MAG: type II toxin-antitoxin system VapC family toxin [Deltaproteobacteria bacterium]|nr:type II toxin-antitoxin system VapC family toxin [Deltaproteobacteria bacterium]